MMMSESGNPVSLGMSRNAPTLAGRAGECSRAARCGGKGLPTSCRSRLGLPRRRGTVRAMSVLLWIILAVVVALVSLFLLHWLGPPRAGEIATDILGRLWRIFRWPLRLLWKLRELFW